jgi:putative DNA primase/helicase
MMATSILDGVRVLAYHGGLVEARILAAPRAGTVSGYFDDLDALAKALGRWDGRGLLYVTLNPVNPALLARAVNRLKPFAKEATADADIERRVWFPVDVDPKRPKGISSTQGELDAAVARRDDVVKFLGELGFPEPVRAQSGNGAHSLWAVDLPNDTETRGLVERALKALGARFTDERVALDESVFNAARIWKVYGSLACKGDATAERPHRRAALESIPADLLPVERELLEALAAMAPRERSAPRPVPGTTGAGAARLDLVAEFEARGWYLRALRDGKHAVRCPWSEAHSGQSGLSESCLFEPREPEGVWGYDCKHASCARRTIRDVLARLRPTRASATTTTAQADAPWPPLAPLPADRFPVPACDVDALLPEPFSCWVSDIAERSQCPVDYLAVGAIVTVASVIGRQVGIKPKAKDDWLVIPNLWGLAVGPPGVMKTPALQETLRPLGRLVHEAAETHVRQMKTFEFAVLEERTRKEELKQRLKQAVTKGEPVGPFRDAFEALAPAAAPVERRYLVNDVTVEALGKVLNENPNGVLLFRDELIGLLRLTEREGHQNDRAFFCEAWSGTSSYVYDRIERGKLLIDPACLSLLGGTTPDGLYGFLAQESGPTRVLPEDGLFQRFQVSVFPDVATPWTDVDRYPDTASKTGVFAVFRALADLDGAALGQHAPDLGDRFPFLRFAPEAQEAFRAWRRDLETRIRPPTTEDSALVSHFAKYRSLFPSLALILHLIDCVEHGAAAP